MFLLIIGNEIEAEIFFILHFIVSGSMNFPSNLESQILLYFNPCQDYNFRMLEKKLVGWPCIK
jgi:hypothetical protein